MASKSIELAEYWNGIHTGFQAMFASISKAIKHPVSGHAPEQEFRKLFAHYLPRRYQVEPGFVADTNKNRSDHIDLIIVDAEHIPPLYLNPPQSVFATEAVVAAIEVTAAPKAKVKSNGALVSKFEADLRKLTVVRTMGAVRRYREPTKQVKKGNITYVSSGTVLRTPAPRTFLVTCGDEWESRETYQQNLVAALNKLRSEGQNVWLHGALSLKHGYLTFFAHTEFKCKWIVENPLLEFVFAVNMAISSIDTGKIDLRRYRPTAPEIGADA